MHYPICPWEGSIRAGIRTQLSGLVQHLDLWIMGASSDQRALPDFRLVFSARSASHSGALPGPGHWPHGFLPHALTEVSAVGALGEV